MERSFTSLPWTPLYTQSGGDSAADTDNNPVLLYAVALTVAFTLGVYAFETYIDTRQMMAYTSKEFPPALETIVAQLDAKSDDKLLPQLQTKFEKAQTYGFDKIRFGMMAALYDVMETMVFLGCGFLPFMWDKAVELSQQYTGWSLADGHEIRISLVFMGLVMIVGTITSLPFELYSTFLIEQKHGFNKMTLGLFFNDKLKTLALTACLGSPFMAILLWIIQQGGPYFYVYLWAFLFCFSVAMMTLVPVFIMPLFNKYEPLPAGQLKTRIYELADELKYPLTKLFVMDGSKRSSHSNAFMFGFGNNKRIVLFDTLLKQVNESEILAILGHELGHWKLGHTISNFVTTQVYFGAAFFTFACVYQSTAIPAAFGFDSKTDGVPTLIALLLFFQTIWAPVDKILNFVLTVVSRHNEFGADEFSAVQLKRAGALQSGLCKIHLENLGAMRPDPLYSAYHYSHPPLVERLQAMMNLQDKMDKKQE